MNRNAIINEEPSMEDKAIPRRTVNASLSLSTGRNLSGEIQIDVDGRLSDFMNKPEKFMILCDKNNDMKIVNKDFIVEVSLKEEQKNTI